MRSTFDDRESAAIQKMLKAFRVKLQDVEGYAGAPRFRSRGMEEQLAETMLRTPRGMVFKEEIA